MRAGIVSNRPRARTLVPRARRPRSTTGAAAPELPGPTPSRQASRPSRLLTISSRATAAAAARASPRKPRVSARSRSSTLTILLVAWACQQSPRSSRVMPPPSSLTSVRRMPPPSMASSTVAAPASMALSINSRARAAGRSTTSPAAILRATSGASTRTGRVCASMPV